MSLKKLWTELLFRFTRITKFTLSTMVLFYRQFLSPLFGGACRFEPSCSCYAQQAIQTLPPQIALPLILKRICRCYPGKPFSIDPVPTHTENLQRKQI